MSELNTPEGCYELYADDDDVIGLTVAKTYPKGYAIVRTDPPLMDAFDEYEVGKFLAWCLSNHATLAAQSDRSLHCGFCGQEPEAHGDSDAGPMSVCPDHIDGSDDA